MTGSRHHSSSPLTSSKPLQHRSPPSPPPHPHTSHTMLRIAFLRSARAATRAAPRFQTPIARPAARSSVLQSRQITPAFSFQSVRCYSAPAGLSQDEVEGRILDLLKNFDKVRRCASQNTISDAMANICPGHRPFKGIYISTAIHSRANSHTLQLSGTSHFSNDLGLDSLDTVEVVMAIEEVSLCHRTSDWHGN